MSAKCQLNADAIYSLLSLQEWAGDQKEDQIIGTSRKISQTLSICIVILGLRTTGADLADKLKSHIFLRQDRGSEMSIS